LSARNLLGLSTANLPASSVRAVTMVSGDVHEETFSKVTLGLDLEPVSATSSAPVRGNDFFSEIADG